jgi:regulator of cell morphogenesis and NO signaling
MLAERGKIFTWQYIQKGPQWWEVEIKKNEAGETVGEIAAKDLRKAEVFKKYGIDFCCGGKKTLKQACAEANIDAAPVEAALEASNSATAQGNSNDYNRWQADFLADYIYNQHHIYYYEEGPVISDLADKVAARHGHHFTELYEVRELYKELQGELHSHFIKEEKVLFPFIKAIIKAKRTGDFSEVEAFPSVKEPVQMMEMEHEGAGEILLQLRKTTNNYRLPEDACNSFSLLYKKLEALEADLHQHIHLENNILFPKALQLERELRK